MATAMTPNNPVMNSPQYQEIESPSLAGFDLGVVDRNRRFEKLLDKLHRDRPQSPLVSVRNGAGDQGKLVLASLRRVDVLWVRFRQLGPRPR
jgi:hypothetical protein